MIQEYKMFINGEWVNSSSDKKFQDRNHQSQRSKRKRGDVNIKIKRIL